MERGKASRVLKKRCKKGLGGNSTALGRGENGVKMGCYPMKVGKIRR